MQKDFHHKRIVLKVDWKIDYLQAYLCIFQTGNFTGWSSEGVIQATSQFTQPPCSCSLNQLKSWKKDFLPCFVNTQESKTDSGALFCSFFVCFVFMFFIFLCKKFESPHQDEVTATARAELNICTSVCSIFVCPDTGVAASVWDF